MTYNPWKEYDAAAEWSAKRGLKGEIGDPLPNLLSGPCLRLINDDPEAFQFRVRLMGYALACEMAERRSRSVNPLLLEAQP